VFFPALSVMLFLPYFVRTALLSRGADCLVEGHPVEGHPVEGHPVEGHPVEGHPVESHPAQIRHD
jgi:hypothetical protein